MTNEVRVLEKPANGEILSFVTVVAQGDVNEIELKKNMTLGEILEEAGYDPSEVTQVRVNNVTITDMDFIPSHGDQVHLLREIAGAN